MDHNRKSGNKWQSSYLAMKLLTTHSTSRTGYYCICSCKQNSTWVVSYIHACTNETHSIVNRSHNKYRQHKLTKLTEMMAHKFLKIQLRIFWITATKGRSNKLNLPTNIKSNCHGNSKRPIAIAMDKENNALPK